MNDIRARFEEIWPVPEGVAWAPNIGAYVCNDKARITIERIDLCTEWDARLDTFTRCQETTDVYVSLVDELVASLENTERALAGMLFAFDDGVGREWSEDILDYARKLVSAKEYVK